MGSVVLPTQGPLYFDANCFIYTVEQIPPYSQALVPIWQYIQANNLAVFTSALTLLEVLVKPLKNADVIVEQGYRTVLTQTPDVTMQPITIAILEKAAQLRASLNVKTPDAIHVATALDAGCSSFFTNDQGLVRVKGIQIILLDSLIVP